MDYSEGRDAAGGDELRMSAELKRIALMERCPLIDFSKTVDQRLIDLVNDYTYNAYELCRGLNGQPPRLFRGCHYTARGKPFGKAARTACMKAERRCEVGRSNVRARMEKMRRRGEIKSLLLRWFDPRPTGRYPTGMATDKIRFYYRNRKGLANRLKDDIDLILREKYGSLDELLALQVIYEMGKVKEFLIIKLIKEYWQQLAELQCILLEFMPDAKITVSYKVSDTCTLVYTVAKE